MGVPGHIWAVLVFNRGCGTVGQGQLGAFPFMVWAVQVPLSAIRAV